MEVKELDQSEVAQEQRLNQNSWISMPLEELI